MNKKEKIDGEKLRAEILKRGETPMAVSRAIGRNDDYISHLCKLNYMMPSTAVMLERLFNIKLEDYIAADGVPETVAEAQPGPEEKSVFDYDKLYQTVYSAVYQAVKTAWMDE